MKISWLAFACLFRVALFADASSPHSARKSFDRGFQGCRKARHALIATMSALVLDLLIASAKDSYDTQRTGSLRCPIACNSIVFWLTTEGKGVTLTTGRASCDGDGYSMAYP